MSDVISKIKNITEGYGDKKKLETYEDYAAEHINDYINKKSFYELPTNEILTIIEKSEIREIELIWCAISKMRRSKGNESTLLLNVIKKEDATFEECIKTLSKFEQCQFCRRANELYEDEKNLPVRDFRHENEELKKKISIIRKEMKLETETTHISSVTEKPSDFEKDICKAAEMGNLASVKYLVEKCHENAAKKDGHKRTPLIIASNYGHLDIVRYLYETCHADAETEDIYGNTSINYASVNGHLNIVKYLYEMCHANVETKDSAGYTPINNASLNGHLDIVKYLYETCHANVETKDNRDNTPINNASRNCHLEIVKYLCETCHAKITEETIKMAVSTTIKVYLNSKK